MSSMTLEAGVVVGGVDTHSQTHHAAVIDQLARPLGDREVATTPAGYRALVAWLRTHGEPSCVGVEGTGAYGVGLIRQLRAARVAVVEVDRPNRQIRAALGKSDPLDAYAAARAALTGSRVGAPKARDGAVEAIRALRVARRGAVGARTQTVNQLKALLLTGPTDLREHLRHLPTPALVAACARLRASGPLADAGRATRVALRRLARRYQRGRGHPPRPAAPP